MEPVSQSWWCCCCLRVLSIRVSEGFLIAQASAQQVGCPEERGIRGAGALLSPVSAVSLCSSPCPTGAVGTVGWQGSLGRRSAHQGSQHCRALASGFRLEIGELGTARGVLREEMGAKGVSLFPCFDILQFGLFFHY